jgi:hypothetical protein
LSIQNLSTFRIKSEYARASILGYIQVLESDGEGLIEPGQEKLDLFHDGDSEEQPVPRETNSPLDASATNLLLLVNDPVEEADIFQYTPFVENSIGQQAALQNANDSILSSLESTQLPDMLALTSHPWGDITPAFNDFGWSPETWQFFPGPTFSSS